MLTPPNLNYFVDLHVNSLLADYHGHETGDNIHITTND